MHRKFEKYSILARIWNLPKVTMIVLFSYLVHIFYVIVQIVFVSKLFFALVAIKTFWNLTIFRVFFPHMRFQLITLEKTDFTNLTIKIFLFQMDGSYVFAKARFGKVFVTFITLEFFFNFFPLIFVSFIGFNLHIVACKNTLQK